MAKCCGLDLSFIIFIILASVPLCAGTPVIRARRQSFNFSMDMPQPEDTDSDTGSLSPDCLINICMFNSPCPDNQECIYSAENCSHDCVNSTNVTPTDFVNDTGSDNPLDSNTGSPEQLSCSEMMIIDCSHGTCIIEDNSVTCKCDKGWTGTICNIPCTLECTTHGYCDVDYTRNEEYCNCEWPWRGPRCSELPPPDPEYSTTWVYKLIGGVVAGFLVLLAVIIIGFIYLWRKRFVVVMKIVYHFLPYEDSDGKLFDAFVSYRSTPEDESFVYGTLFPRLENEMNFKLCVHLRDFMPGETISNNILWAIENSRRTILVLSPRYLDSEWTRLEYQQAQQEMLRRKQRIIPIMLEDVTKYRETMDNTLWSILQSVTYLSYPGSTAEERQQAKFWKRLFLSMPKKKDQQLPPEDADFQATLDHLSPTGSVSLQSKPDSMSVGGESPLKNNLKNENCIFGRCWNTKQSKSAPIQLIGITFLSNDVPQQQKK